MMCLHVFEYYRYRVEKLGDIQAYKYMVMYLWGSSQPYMNKNS